MQISFILSIHSFFLAEMHFERVPLTVWLLLIETLWHKLLEKKEQQTFLISVETPNVLTPKRLLYQGGSPVPRSSNFYLQNVFEATVHVHLPFVRNFRGQTCEKRLRVMTSVGLLNHS